MTDSTFTSSIYYLHVQFDMLSLGPSSSSLLVRCPLYSSATYALPSGAEDSAEYCSIGRDKAVAAFRGSQDNR